MTGTAAGRAPDPAPRPAVFLERQGYRRRRLMDAARLMPLIGVALFALPLLWPNPDSAAVGEAQTVPLSYAITYVFAVWFALVIAGLLFGLSARRWGQMDTPQGGAGRTWTDSPPAPDPGPERS